MLPKTLLILVVSRRGSPVQAYAARSLAWSRRKAEQALNRRQGQEAGTGRWSWDLVLSVKTEGQRLKAKEVPTLFSEAAADEV